MGCVERPFNVILVRPWDLTNLGAVDWRQVVEIPSVDWLDPPAVDEIPITRLVR
jgi:hypothetical protein